MVEIMNSKDLKLAIEDKVDKIVITRSLMLDQPLVLPRHTTLSGKRQENGALPVLMFENSDGVGVQNNNTIMDLVIHAGENKRSIFNAGYDLNGGQFVFSNLTLSGQFSFIVRKEMLEAQLILTDIHVLSADTRGYLEQPQKYGVNVLQGALTIYNFNPDVKSLITVHATGIKIGEKNSPVVGSGIFISGFGDNGGKVHVDNLETDAIYSTGKIPFGVADIITGAIFIVNGVHAKHIENYGEVVTYGVNDMVLDAWGKVDNWIVNAPVVSYGPSGVGFVNFGRVINFNAKAPIETYGLGARGYNQYDGTLEHGDFDSIRTFGDGSVGVQISKHVGEINIHGGIKTHGGIGNSLVKGVNVDLPAYALSIKNGGSVDKLNVTGNIESTGDGVITYLVDDGGIVDNLSISGAVIATGKGSLPFKVNDGGKTSTNFTQSKGENK